jgi:L,D-peptidoglycan transpeptidase YkuD (ErfK/YbiS/YcfS/YnhG family)
MENITVKSNGYLFFKGHEYKCALGKGGVVQNKKEGDGATPLECFPIRFVLYRKDRVDLPEIPFDIREILKSDGWCDDPSDEMYNRQVVLPYKSRAELLWREDHIYDVIVVLGYNDNPVVPGKGSAVFMHIAREGYKPTDGCIALNRNDLLEILSKLDKNTKVCVTT